MKNILLTLFSLVAFFTSFGQLTITRLKTENRVNPIGLEEQQPRFSWQLQSTERNVMQQAYEIRVGDAPNKNNVWQSGKVNSTESHLVPFSGTNLASAKKYFWQVRVWDNHGHASRWSEVAYWQTAFLRDSDWQAQWIQSASPEEDTNQPSPLLRKTFRTRGPVREATAFITALGLYEARINGKRVGDACLTPGWTSYNHRLQYQQYDVTSLLQGGKENAIGVQLGNGWYRGYIGFSGQHNFYGKEIALLFQLEITYADGSKERVASDGSWTSSTGAIRSSEIYHGETVDARMNIAGWSEPGTPSGTWSPVKVTDKKVKLIATYNEPIRRHETFSPKKIFRTPKGEQVIDFGQNLVGWVRIRTRGKSGDKIIIHHAEVLDKDGNFYTENLRPARQENVFILSGNGEESFEPTFTFQGFRYIRVSGYPEEVKADDFTATALYSDMPLTGSFTSSNPLINQLQHNIQWGQRGNFLDVPTDCPQRDERLGWTGDAQAFSRTATFNFDVHNFFAKWLKDVAADQIEGSVPFVVPNVLGTNAAGSAGWADAATIIPWNMYLAYGDKRILEDQYESMKAWVGFMERKSTNDLWNTGFHFGDWLFYRPFDDNDGRSAVTDKYLIAQCFYAHSTQLVINTARVLGNAEDVTRYEGLLSRIKSAFVREYMTPSGRLISGTQTAWVLALQFDMLPEGLRDAAAKKLADNVIDYGNHLTTGFLGTPYLCHVLSRFGYSDLAYTLLLQETYPSWLYPVKMGATTIWERWDGIKPDGTFQTPGMNSFNHYAYGAIGDWMYRVVAGIDTDPTAPGYRKISIRPTLGALDHAAAELETPYGKVRSAWKKTGSEVELEITVPANTTATTWLPTRDVSSVLTDGKKTEAAQMTVGKDGARVELGSGTYVFRFQPAVKQP